MPIATSHWPTRQARPNESAMTIAGATPVSSRRRRRSARAERVGIAGSRTSSPGGRVGGVDARVGADEAVVRAADQHARAASARSPSLSPRMTSTRRGVLAVLGGRARAPARRAHAVQRDGAALGLRDDLVRDDEHVAVGERARPRRRAGPRGRRPARTVRATPAQRDRDDHEPAGRRRASRAGEAAEHPARVGRAAAAVGERLAQRRRGRRRVSTSSASVSTCSTSHGTPAACREPARGGARLSGPKAGSMTSGGVSSSAFVPLPWRSGTIDDRGLDDRRARAARSSSRRVERRAVAGDEQDAAGALPRSRASMPISVAGALAVLDGRRRAPWRRSRGRSRRRPART